MTSVSNVKVSCIRPDYNNLKEWTMNENNIYIGRKGIVFIINEEGNKERFPKHDSKWANPFKLKNDTLNNVLEKYETYIKDKIKKDPKTYNLEELRGKNLGCWCKPNACHGDILIKLLSESQEIQG